MARGRKRPPSKMQQQAQKQAQQLVSDWAVLTWMKDGTKLGAVPLVVVNWVVLVALVAALYFEIVPRMWSGIALAVFLIYTLSRAGAVMPRRRKTTAAIYAAMQRPAALPRSTATTPVNPDSYVAVAGWGAKARPRKFTLTVGPDSPATTAPYMRMPLEQAIQKSTPPPEDGQDWIFEWPDASHVTATAVPAEDPRVWQRSHDRKMARYLGDRSLFDAARNAADYDFALTVDERKESERNGVTYHFPTKVTWTYGGFDATDPQFRAKVSAEFDRIIRGPGVWIYDWSNEGDLVIELVADDDLRARRKIVSRKINADVLSMIRTNKDSSIDCEVTRWMPEGKKLPDHYPVAVTIDFDTLNLGDRRVRNKFESDFDTAMEASYQGLTWLYDWTPGGTTRLEATAHPSRSKQARRKVTERNLRNVIESKFGSSKNFVDCDIVEWQPQLSADGSAMVQVAEVKFGSMDVNARETRDGFQEHWDSLSTDNDWHYAWDAPKGKVTITAVPPLPSEIVFPSPGTAEFDEAIALAQKGIFRFGPQKGGGWLDWDLNDVPHGLVGGKTGSGKSVALSTALLYAMYLPGDLEIVVCDPKMTDFTWTPEFPSVMTFAATDVEICQAISETRQELERRQSLLNKFGTRKLEWLRDKVDRDPDLASQVGPIPKRRLLFIDEIADFLARSADEDVEEIKNEARGDLEKIARLARASEINIICAAQKPDAKIISTQLRSQLGFRLGVGPLDQYESEQILNSNHGTRFPEAGTPKGRSWAYDSKNGYRQAQIMFLPDDDMPAPWDPSISLSGVRDIVRHRLAEIGYQQIHITNRDGGKEPRWVILDEPDAGTPSDAADPVDDSGGTPTLRLVAEDPEPDLEVEEVERSSPEEEPEPAPGPDAPALSPQDTSEPPAQPSAGPATEQPSPRGPRKASRAPGPAEGQQRPSAVNSQPDGQDDDGEDEDALWS
ncbi:MAG: hypothetical protein DI630_29280 [Gordonia sp. (in: high G+C Gram-positive bacteria)]|nr:MAG: hypothetical protein DI630_29280 [Gordonia sp. (in: high G+C Gram-positive bacteria)]